jgi:hypothetical protein
MRKIAKLCEMHQKANAVPDEAEKQDGSIPDGFDPDDDDFAVNEDDIYR